MDREQIMSAEVGAALNAQVATAVLGWSICKEVSPYIWNVPLEQPLFREWDNRPISETPPFSENIVYSWGLAEFLVSEGRYFEISKAYEDGAEVDCVIGRPRGDDPNGDFAEHAIGRTVHLAICRAALLAKLNRVPA